MSFGEGNGLLEAGWGVDVEKTSARVNYAFS